MKRLILDTNLLVRFLVQDDAKQAVAATKLINDAQIGVYELLLDRMVLADLVYVLISHYKRTRVDVANTALAIVRSPYVRVEQEPELIDSLLRFRDQGVDLVDAWLAATGASSGAWRSPRLTAISTSSKTSNVMNRRPDKGCELPPTAPEMPWAKPSSSVGWESCWTERSKTGGIEPTA